MYYMLVETSWVTYGYLMFFFFRYHSGVHTLQEPLYLDPNRFGINMTQNGINLEVIT